MKTEQQAKRRRPLLLPIVFLFFAGSEIMMPIKADSYADFRALLGDFK
jgi:hypothetical protein